jgi:GTP-binding protein EngB required for normal cell division
MSENPPDSLSRLLVRCHRDELVPLARLCGVNDTNLGMGDLARQTALNLRRRASHGLGNILLRQGEGEAYEAILGALARTEQLAPEENPETQELALLKHWFIRRWKDQTPEARTILWQRLSMEGEAPGDGQKAAEAASLQLGRGFGYQISQLGPPLKKTFRISALLFGLSPLGFCLRPVLLIWVAWWFFKPDPQKSLELVIEVARLRQIVRRRVTIGVVGSPSSGKDSAIKALFGIDSGNISPIAGSTREVSIQKLPGSTALFLVNTPGMGDVIEKVTEEARQVLDHIDLYLYVVNAEGGVQAREKGDYDRCVATGKPVLAVVNKIDVLRPRDKERYLQDARQKLGASEEHFTAVAFDPLPELSPSPINTESVQSWLKARLLELGKDPDELPDPAHFMVSLQA